MRRRKVLAALGTVGALGFGGIVTASQTDILDLPLQEPEEPPVFERPEEAWHPAGFRRVFDYGEYADQQLILGLLDEEGLESQFSIFLQSGAGRVDYFIDIETGEVYQDSTASTNKDYYNEITRVEHIDGTLYLEADTKTDGVGGPIIDYPSVWEDIDAYSLQDLDLITVAFTDRWDKTTYQSLEPEIPEVDLAYHLEHGVEYVLQDTPDWELSDQAVEDTFMAADVRTQHGLEIYVEIVVEQPTYHIDVEEAVVMEDGTLDLSVIAYKESELTDEPNWTRMDKIVTVMNRGEIDSIAMNIEGARRGPYDVTLSL